MANNEFKLDDKTQLVAANNVHGLLAVKKDGQAGAVSLDAIALEAGKKVGDAVKIEGNVLPVMGTANKVASVRGGSAGRTYTYTDPVTSAVSSFDIGANMVADLFWDGVAKSWSKGEEDEMAMIEITDGFDSSSVLEAGTVKNDKILFDEINGGFFKEVPSGVKESLWNIPLSAGYKYYDSRCVLSDVNSLNVINIVTNGSGNIKVLAIDLNGNTIHSEVKTAISGVNTFTFSDKSVLENKTFYVGIEIVESGAEMKSSTEIIPSGTEKWSPFNTVNFSTVAYPLAYSIELTDFGIKGRLAKIEILLKSDTTNIQESLSKYGKVTLDAKEFLIEETITVPNGCTLDGVFGRSILRKGLGLTSEILRVEGKEDVSIKNIRLKGDLSSYNYEMNGVLSGVGIIANESEALANTYIGTNNGMQVKSSERIVLENIQFHNLNGIGLLADRVGRDYIHGMKASKLFFYNCYKGLEAKNEHEFSSYSDIMVSLCQIGVDVASGNLSFSHPILTRCRVGMIYRNGYNDAHGVVTGAEIKHHQIAGLLVDNVVNGQLFNGLQMQYADLIIRNSRGVIIPDLYFTDGTVRCSGGSGKNIIDNFFAYNIPTIENTGNLVINNNINWNS